MSDIRHSLQNLADAISPETGTQDGYIDAVDTSIKRIADALPGKLDETDPEAIANAISDWLENHPEAIVVNDGTITRAKLDDSVGQAVDEVSKLKADFSQLAERVSDIEVAVSLLDPGYQDVPTDPGE